MTGQVYWHARLSEQYPTLEVRAPDVQLDVDSAVTIAGIARGLVVTALREARHGVRPLDPAGSILNASGWHAARHGLGGDLVDPRHGTPAPAAEVVGALLDHIAPALKDLGDADRVAAGAQVLLEEGTGAAPAAPRAASRRPRRPAPPRRTVPPQARPADRPRPAPLAGRRGQDRAALAVAGRAGHDFPEGTRRRRRA